LVRKKRTPTINEGNSSALTAGKGRNPGVAGKGASSWPGEQGTLELWGDLNIEEVLSRENMSRALKRVKENKGSAGVDEMTVEELEPYLKEEWPRIRKEVLEGRYRPKPVKRVMIPKPDGGKRPLGIPTVLDRLIQQAVHQAISPVF
jgi:RNA-directed DNA polymerase